MKYPVFAALVVLLAACGEKKSPTLSDGQSSAATTNAVIQDTATKKKYFPVMDFLKGEIAYVDSLPVGIKKFTITGASKKYEYIKPEEFHRLAAEFMPAEISDSILMKEYQETSFMDKSSNSATFFYSTNNPALAVKRVDVLTVKGDIYDKVKSVYIEKHYRSGDTGFVKKLYWRPQRSFQLITQASIGTQEPKTGIVNVVWDNREE